MKYETYRYFNGKTSLVGFISTITPTQLLGKNDVDGVLVQHTCSVEYVTSAMF